MRFSSTELRDLAKAWLLLSVAFTIALHGSGVLFSSQIFWLLLVSGITVGLGFLLHELSHKFVAQRFGCWAEFQSWDNMLWLCVLMSFFGFLFAAPGGVMIRGMKSAEKYGPIALAGPLMNVFLSLAFLLARFILPAFADVASYGASVNAWLAVFNLIPFGPLDGAKVLRWNKAWYAGALVLAGIVMLVTQV